FCDHGSEQPSFASASQWEWRRIERHLRIWEHKSVPGELLSEFELLGGRGVQHHRGGSSVVGCDVVSFTWWDPRSSLQPDLGSRRRHPTVQLDINDGFHAPRRLDALDGRSDFRDANGYGHDEFHGSSDRLDQPDAVSTSDTEHHDNSNTAATNMPMHDLAKHGGARHT